MSEVVDLRRRDSAQRIEAAAVELFFRNGFPSTTIREITVACGLTPAALYNHFPSKESLLYTVVREVHLALEEAISRAVQAAPQDPATQLYELIRDIVRVHADNPLQGQVATTESKWLRGHELDEMLAIQRRVRAAVEDVIRFGLAQGHFTVRRSDTLTPPDARDDEEVQIAAKAMLSMAVAVSSWFRPGGAETAEEVADLYGMFALRLVGAAV